MKLRTICLCFAPIIVAGCTTRSAISPEVPQQARHGAHDLLVNTAACYLGGMWGDVEGQAPAERTMTSEARCRDVVDAVFSHDNHDRYLQLRAHEALTVAEVRNKLAALADSEPAEAHRKGAYLRLFDALTAAEDEVMLARRAGHRVLRDIPREPETLSASEAAALPQLEASAAFDALSRVDAGDLRHEAQVFTLFVVLDRMQVAEQLPVHLKPYVVAEPFHEVFGAAAPDLPHDASKPLARGSWLTYLTEVAASAGHPVGDKSASLIAEHEAAIAGILQGVADRLKAQEEGVSPDTELSRMVLVTVRALEQSKLRVL